MGENGPGNPILMQLVFWVAASLVLVIIGFVLRRRGMLRTRVPALLWAILCILPLFGAGFVMFVGHTIDEATGKTQPNKNAPPLENQTS